MQPVKIENETLEIGKPRDWDAKKLGSECAGLSVRVESGAGGLPMMVSKWKPSPADLEVLNNGGSVMLGVYGTQHPVVTVFVDNSTPLPTEQSKVVN